MSVRVGFGALVLLALVLNGTFSFGQDDAKKGVDLAKLSRYDGFFPFHWDDEKGRVLLEIDEWETPFLYVSSLATGLGSNPVGLDRGQLGDSRIVFFRRVGNRAYLIQQNMKYRATSEDEAERRAIRESFAESILWAGKFEEVVESNSFHVDLTSFLIRDAHDCVAVLEATEQGSFSLDNDRSYIHLPRTKAFPDNTEFEATLTFSSRKPGRLARRVAADGKAISMRQHHSFVRLPDAGYTPRSFDPRVGCFAVSYSDYGVPIDESIEKRLITRHRLEKVDPQATRSEPKEPIVYYVDPGVPEPVRSALVEGASWWNEAFESAGFDDAFQVKILPDDADPMDVRYNVIQWVHRATRGWSYGQSVIDPRTGEIIKGHVLLGSLRVRQDHLLFEGLTSMPSRVNACSCGMGYVPAESHLAQLDDNLSSAEVALARIRQLSAHEVGHTLGFAHNFAASTYGGRASVMDYPSPLVRITEGRLDLSDAYGIGIGSWDKFAVQYAYSQFPSDTESAELEKLVSDAISGGMLYVTDADARPAGAAHPLGNLWDNGSDPVAALQHEMNVRAIALNSFGAQAIQDGLPMADLEKSLVPVYLHHRYQVDATAKVVGGYLYTYAVKGDQQTPQEAVPVATQRAAFESLLATIKPDVLVIPDRILDLIPPRVGSSASDRERFGSTTAPVFDPTNAMRVAAGLTLGNLMQPERASRVARIPDANWNLNVMLEELYQAVFETPMPAEHAQLEATRIVQSEFVKKLLALTAATSTSHDARSVANGFAKRLEARLRFKSGRQAAELNKDHFQLLADDLARFLARPSQEAVAPARANPPPGSPIGAR